MNIGYTYALFELSCSSKTYQNLDYININEVSMESEPKCVFLIGILP